MKLCSILLLFAMNVWAADREQAHRLLAEAAGAMGEEYLACRTQLEAMGDEVLPLLRAAAEDPALTWQQRLTARIIHERITRGDEIKALRFHDWGSYPPYQERMPPVAGPSVWMHEFVLPKLKEAGLWYYYIELNWKNTAEAGVAWGEQRYRQGDRRFSTRAWPDWCRRALEGQPEEIYLWMAIADRIEKEEGFLQSHDNRGLFRSLISKKLSMTVPSIVKGWDEYEKHEWRGVEVFPGSLKQGYEYYWDQIISFAAAEHAQMLEDFMAKRLDMLGALAPRLEDVRKREPVKMQEPPFRCEKKPPLEGMREPPPGFFDPPKPPEPPPADTSPEDIIIHVN